MTDLSSVMVLTRNQYENMSKEKLIQQLLNHDDIAAKLPELTKKGFGEFSEKYETFHSELNFTQNCNSLLPNHFYRLKRNAVSNSQCHKRETLEINPVPLNIQDNVWEETVCYALSPTEINVSPDQLHSCHRLNKKDQMIVNFKCRKRS